MPGGCTRFSKLDWMIVRSDIRVVAEQDFRLRHNELPLMPALTSDEYVMCKECGAQFGAGFSGWVTQYVRHWSEHHKRYRTERRLRAKTRRYKRIRG